MVWYGMVNVDLYSAIITRVSNALNTLVSGEKPGCQALSKGLISHHKDPVAENQITADHIQIKETGVSLGRHSL